MNSFASLALSTEPPREELLNRPPFSKKAFIISRKMVKHILGVALLQLIIIFAVAYGGDHWFPEPDAEWRFERADSSSFVFPGRKYDWDGTTPLYIEKEGSHGASRHYTNVFNILVVMQIFNMLCVRKINDEKNIFQGIFNNKIYLAVWAFIIAAQAIIVEFGSTAIKVSPGGLPWQHWLLAIGFGVLVVIWDFILRFIPDKFLPRFGSKKLDPLHHDDHNVLSLRIPRTLSFNLRNLSNLSSDMKMEGSFLARRNVHATVTRHKFFK